MEQSPFKSTSGLARIRAAFGYSMRGLALAWRYEHAFRQELFLAVPLLITAAVLQLTAVERVLLIGSVVLVLIVELLNSAIEAVVDRVSLERHELSGHAKDLGSAAVFVAVALCGLTWGLVLFPR